MFEYGPVANCAEGSLDTHSHASLECNLSNSDSLNESSSDVASNCTARSVRSRRSRSADSCGEPDGSGTSDYSSPPALDYDDETISNTSSCEDEDMEATDPLSINDESLGSRHRAYPRNLIDDGRDSHLNSLRPALDELATLPDDSETGSHSLDRFVKTQDDQWNVLSSRSSLLSDTSDNRALDILTELLDAVDAAFDATKH